MTQQAAGYEDCDIPLGSGRLRMRRWGAADAPAVLCVPGLSANLDRPRPGREGLPSRRSRTGHSEVGTGRDRRRRFP